LGGASKLSAGYLLVKIQHATRPIWSTQIAVRIRVLKPRSTVGRSVRRSGRRFTDDISTESLLSVMTTAQLNSECSVRFVTRRPLGTGGSPGRSAARVLVSTINQDRGRASHVVLLGLSLVGYPLKFDGITATNPCERLLEVCKGSAPMWASIKVGGSCALLS